MLQRNSSHSVRVFSGFVILRRPATVPGTIRRYDYGVQSWHLTADEAPLDVPAKPFRFAAGTRTWVETLAQARAFITGSVKRFPREEKDAPWIVETWI
jgi:hypothetical protein